MNDIVVRLADLEDVPALARLRWDFDLEDPQTPNMPEQSLEEFTHLFSGYYRSLVERDRVTVMVADDNGEIVSNAWLITIDRVPRLGGATHPLGYITNVFTLPSYRGAGIGREIMNALVDFARLIPTETLVVWPSKEGQVFYERLGFAATAGVHPDGHIPPMELRTARDDLRARQSRRVVVEDYDPMWPAYFEEESRTLTATIGRWAESIVHVGSTSVPGLGAKPIIDIMVGLRELTDFKHTIRPLRSIGYVHKPWADAGLPDRRYFSKDTDGVRSHHLHMTYIGSSFWVKHLAFRDHLRTNRDSAARYFELKRSLAAKFEWDTIGYTDSKTEFIENALRVAGYYR